MYQPGAHTQLALFAQPTAPSVDDQLINEAAQAASDHRYTDYITAIRTALQGCTPKQRAAWIAATGIHPNGTTTPPITLALHADQQGFRRITARAHYMRAEVVVLRSIVAYQRELLKQLVPNPEPRPVFTTRTPPRGSHGVWLDAERGMPSSNDPAAWEAYHQQKLGERKP